MHSDVILVLVVGTALAFDFTNGFHDTANVVATSISTRALRRGSRSGWPRCSTSPARSSRSRWRPPSARASSTRARSRRPIVFGGLIGAITWNLVTWYFGLPSSSSHALIGGVVGAAFAAKGSGAVMTDGLLAKVVIPALVAPVLAFFVAGVAIVLCYRIVGRLRPGPVSSGFKFGQLISGGMLALAHGTNDAQKTMGVIVLALIAHGDIAASNFHVPTWVVVSAASAIALGTYAGGWRIIKTMGSRIIKMDTAQGFAAQGSGAAVILAASHVGFPLSTTHVISGGVMGAGAAKRVSAVRWGIAGNMVVAWVLTIPAAGAIGAAIYGITRIFGENSTAGPVVVAALILIGSTLVFARRLRRGSPITAAEA